MMCNAYVLCFLHHVGFFILFSCARVDSDNVVVSKLTISAYTKERNYAPIELFLLKTCGKDSLGKTLCDMHPNVAYVEIFK